MVIKQLDTLSIPELPKLTNGFIVIQEPAWNALTKYVQSQTDTINELIRVIDIIATKHATDAVHIADEFSKLNKELSEIAQALEGEFSDD